MTGAALRTWRRARRLEQTELAAWLGVHATTCSNHERGRTHIPYMMKYALEAWDREHGFSSENTDAH